MRPSALGSACIALALGFVVACGGDDVQHLVENGGFESGDFTTWTVSNAGNGGFVVTDDTIVQSTAVTGAGVPLPPEGTYAAVTDMSAAGTRILYQDIDIPNGAQATFRATIYVENLAGDYVIAPTVGLDYTSEANQQVRVDVMDPAAAVADVGAGVLLNIFQTQPGDSLILPPRQITADLSAFAGQTVRIRFAEVDNQNFQHFGVDAVDVSAK